MFGLIIILVVAGGYAIFFVLRTLLSDHVDVKGTPVGGEVFPRIEIYNPNSADVGAETDVVDKTVRKSPFPKSRAVMDDKRNVKDENVELPDKEKEEKVSLKNRSEARRAFIHAEILNRKYN